MTVRCWYDVRVIAHTCTITHTNQEIASLDGG